MDLTTKYWIILVVIMLGMVLFALVYSMIAGTRGTRRRMARQAEAEARAAVLKDRERRAALAMKPAKSKPQGPIFVDMATGEVVELTDNRD